MNLLPGDVLLVSRVRSFRSWLSAPVGSLISWRIQSTTGSPWNHVAAHVGNGVLLEAEWGKGIVRSRVEHYEGKHYRLAIARPPSDVDPWKAVEWWEDNARHKPGYDWRSIVLMRVAGLLYGHQGIRQVIRAHPNDGAYICSEWAACGWVWGGYGLGDEVLVTPADFSKHVVWDSAKAERRVA